MSHYKIVRNLLRYSENNNDYILSDKLTNIAIRLAQTNSPTITLDEFNSLPPNIQTFITTQNKMITELQKNNYQLIEANSELQQNQIPNNLTISPSTITPGGEVVEVNSPVQPVSVRNQNYIDPNTINFTNRGPEFNSPVNI